MGAAHGHGDAPGQHGSGDSLDVFCGRSTSSCCTRSRTGESFAVRPARYPNHEGVDEDGCFHDQLFCSRPQGPPPGVDECSKQDKLGPPPGFGMTGANSWSTQSTMPVGPGIHEGLHGEETYEDGSSYSGQLLDGRRHGHGTWISPSERYSGQWKGDHRDGQGRQTWQDDRTQRTYEGQFKSGNFDGHGRMEWHTTNGLMVYEGQYLNDLKHGMGRYTWPDGRIYDGQWREGKRWGRAMFTNSLGVRREGEWAEDKVERWFVEGHSPGDAGQDVRWDAERRDLRRPANSPAV